MWATFDFDGCHYLSQTRPSPKSLTEGFDWHNITRVMIWHPIVAGGVRVDGLDRPGDQVEVRIVRVDQRRTPSTGLPPVCDGAAAMKIDPPGSVASPHATMPIVAREPAPLAISTAGFAPQDRPIPAIRLARLMADHARESADPYLRETLERLAESIAHPLRLGEHG